MLVDVLVFVLGGVSIGDVLYSAERMLMYVGVVIGDVLCGVISVVLGISRIFCMRREYDRVCEERYRV